METSSSELIDGKSLPSKPIVSDMTVSSKEDGNDESTIKGAESRDETVDREGGENSERDGGNSQPGTSKVESSSSDAAESHGSKNNNKSKSSRYNYPHTGSNGGNVQRSSGPFTSMVNGGRNGGPPSYPQGPPPPSYGSYHGGTSYTGGPPPQHHPGHHHHPYGMQANNGRNNSFPPPPPHYGYHHPHGNPHHPPHHNHPGGMMHYGGNGQSNYSMPHYHQAMQHPHGYATSMNTSDSASISSSRSKSSKSSNKKRTIDGLGIHGSSLPANAYSFRRTDSNSSSTSTVTAGNNTSLETSVGESPHKRERHDPEVDSVNHNMGGLTYDDNRQGQKPRNGHKYHRRDYSAASTASSLSVGGFSLASYEPKGKTIVVLSNLFATERNQTHIFSSFFVSSVGAVEDPMITDHAATKRHKAEGHGTLLVDTQMRTESACSNHTEQRDAQSSRFGQLSIDATKLPTSTSSASSAGNERNLFLTLSTSPLNNDVDATPVSKNTHKQALLKSDHKLKSIFKSKGGVQPKIETAPSDASRPADTPTPPIHGELGSSVTEEHSMLNRHLRNQSFTPLPHLNTNESSGNSPSAAAFASVIAPQLSWSIAGDTPSLGDLEAWDEDHKILKTEVKQRPGSATSADTRNMMISPQDLSFWKEDQEAGDRTFSGTTTPLPAFFDQAGHDGSENHGHSVKKQSDGDLRHCMFAPGSGIPSAGFKSSNKSMPHPVWSKHPNDHNGHDKNIMMGMPPTPMFAGSSEYYDGFGPRSPMGIDRRDSMEFYSAFPPHHGGHHGHSDRVRNLRGRVPPGAHMPPVPLQIPHHMPAHLPMTSPMGLGPKAGLWSPHHHGGIPPPLASPHHMGSPLNNIAQSKRKCVPLKPPIPSKFQGDIEKVKSAQVPEFTSLVNFPGHMSQKQSINLPDGMRCCVMCGQACPCSTGNKNKKNKKQGADGGLAPRSNNAQDLGDKSSGYAIIPTQNKGLCTLCDVNVWVVVSNGLEIKWCKGCKNFRPWAAFGDKGLATKCLRCRERQREKYALQKEEKERARQSAKIKK